MPPPIPGAEALRSAASAASAARSGGQFQSSTTTGAVNFGVSGSGGLTAPSDRNVKLLFLALGAFLLFKKFGKRIG